MIDANLIFKISEHDLSVKKMSDNDLVVKIRSYPKVIFFWPSALLALIWGIVSFFPDHFPMVLYLSTLPNYSEIILNFNNLLAWIFVITLAFNLFVVAFDFPSYKILLIFVAIIALVFILMFVQVILIVNGISFSVLTLVFFFLNIYLPLPTAFYFVYAAIFGAIFGIIWLGRRWEYIEITRNYYIKRMGLFQGGEESSRMTSVNLQFKKDIQDVFEYLLLRSGELTIIPAQGKDVIFLPNVLNINKVEQKLNRILGKMAVDTELADTSDVP